MNRFRGTRAGEFAAAAGIGAVLLLGPGCAQALADRPPADDSAAGNPSAAQSSSTSSAVRPIKSRSPTAKAPQFERALGGHRSVPTVAAADPADLAKLYVGRPTPLTRVVNVGLQIFGALMSPLGGLVALTGIKIPLISDGTPPAFLIPGVTVSRSEFDEMPVWTLTPAAPSGKYVVALHGGAYAAEASVFHYLTYAAVAGNTGSTVVVPDYPLIGEVGGTAAKVVPAAADFISQLITEYGAENVSVLGDSAGGGLAVAAVQRLVERGDSVPGRLVLLAPWLDVTMRDPLSTTINDPLLTIGALRQDGTRWAGDLSPADPIVSPLFGSLAGLPPTTVFSGSLDMLAPDTLRLRDRSIDEGLTNVSFVLRNQLIHDFPIFGFLPEATTISPEIYAALFTP